jgi:hypothetical protein
MFVSGQFFASYVQNITLTVRENENVNMIRKKFYRENFWL